MKHFHHQKQAAGTLHQQQAAGEAHQKYSAENTIKLSMPTMAEEHPEERAAREPLHEPEPIPTVPLSGIREKDKLLDWSGLGDAFKGLSVTTPEGK